MTRITGERRRWADLDELLAFLRRQLWTAPGSAADARLLAAVGDLAVVDPDGSVSLPGRRPSTSASWSGVPSILVDATTGRIDTRSRHPPDPRIRRRRPSAGPLANRLLPADV